MNYEKEIKHERQRWSDLKALISDNAELFRSCWHIGDGLGGGLLELIKEEAGCYSPTSSKTTFKKKFISRSLSKSVFERDMYRCNHCGTHLDLSVDHVMPESKGGKTVISNLQTLCRSCNSSKGVTF